MRNVSAASLLLASTALGQVELDRFERQLEQIQRETRLRVDTNLPVDQRVLVDYGAYLSFSFLSIDDPEGKSHTLRQYDLNGYARVSLDGVHEFFVRARTTYRDFNHGDDFDGRGDDLVEPTLDRATYRFDLRRYRAAYEGEVSEFDFIVSAGRQLVHWANGLTMSNDIDGGVFTVGFDPVSVDLIVGRTRDSSTDIDSSRPGFDEETDRMFYGVMVSCQASPKHTPFVYALMQDDNNENVTLSTTVNGTDVDTQFRYDTFYLGAGSRGSLADNLLYGVEITYQGGRGQSNSFTIDGVGTVTEVDQTREDIHAAALDIQIDYLLNDPNHTRLTFEALLASGDTDRLHTTNTFGGNESGTDDTAFNAFGLVNTGLAFATNASNLLMFRAGAATFPLPGNSLFSRLQVGTNAYLFNKLNSNAPIDEDTSDRSHLGFEVDFFVNWQITSDISWAARYGIFVPGPAIGGDITSNDGNPRHFFYSGITLAF